MPRVTYIDVNGVRTSIEANVGESVMQTAVDNGVDAIVGECGGAMMCATCHVFLDEAWAERLGTRKRGEDSMLEDTAVPCTERSRLSCQIFMSDELDGLVVHTPESQE